MKLKKLARRIKNIYDLDCYPRQGESDQRVKYNSTTWTTVPLLDRTTVLLQKNLILVWASKITPSIMGVVARVLEGSSGLQGLA